MAISSKPLRRILGLTCLAAIVLLWTASSFLASAIFADATYSKPYFVIYFNTAWFVLPLGPFLAWHFYSTRVRRVSRASRYIPISSAEDEPMRPVEGHAAGGDGDAADLSDEDNGADGRDALSSDPIRAGTNLEPLTVRETFNLSAKFSLLWFISNYFNSASLQYTSVASCTILSSTCSVFILVFGAIFRIEKFTVRKLVGVLASLAGVALIAKADSVAESDVSRGTFPYKSPGEIAIGDSMALFAAVTYGIYAVALVKTVGDESRVKMPLFFGFIGICNVVCLWPGFAILHWTGVETFQLPPNGHVWTIVLVNAGISLIADMLWAYSMLFISPLVVTVGLSLTIPLSLLGQILVNSHWASPLYFVGAVIVLFSFIFINHESNEDPQRRLTEQTTNR